MTVYEQGHAGAGCICHGPEAVETGLRQRDSLIDRQSTTDLVKGIDLHERETLVGRPFGCHRKIPRRPCSYHVVEEAICVGVQKLALLWRAAQGSGHAEALVLRLEFNDGRAQRAQWTALLGIGGRLIGTDSQQLRYLAVMLNGDSSKRADELVEDGDAGIVRIAVLELDDDRQAV